MANNQGDHQVNNKYPYQAKHYDPKKHSCNKKKSMNKENVVNIERVSSSSKIWKRPVMPYRFHIQYDSTRNFIKYPSNCMNWARIVNRKTYNAHTNELMEDLNVNPDVPMEVVTRPLPDGVTYIKTVFEYGGMPNYTGTNGRK